MKLTKEEIAENVNIRLPWPVYHIESNNDDSVLIGIDTQIRRNRNNTFSVGWFDTVHDKTMSVSAIKTEGKVFIFKRADKEGGQLYYFRPMTLDIYNERVKNRLDGIEFTKEEDMIDAFLDTASW